MSYTIFAYSLFAAWLACEAYLLWLNYKGRFVYRLKEGYFVQKWLQENIGLMVLPLTLACDFAVIWILPGVLAFFLNIPYAITFPTVVSGMLGLKFMNAIADRLTLKGFEKFCLRCKNKEECVRFLDEKCNQEYLKNAVKMAIQHDKKEQSG